MGTEKVVLLQILIKTVVKFRAEKSFTHLFHAPKILLMDTIYRAQKRLCSDTLKRSQLKLNIYLNDNKMACFQNT